MTPSNTVTKDPVCGMSMNEAFAIHTEYKGKTYYFCGEACRNSFLSTPATYEPKKDFFGRIKQHK